MVYIILYSIYDIKVHTGILNLEDNIIEINSWNKEIQMKKLLKFFF